MPADSPRSVAVTLGVPTFTPAELHKQLDAVLGKGASGTVYSLRDFPGLAVKEILLDGLDQRSIDAAKLELATLPALSHPGILRYHQVIEDDSFIYIVMDRHDGTLECLLIEHKRKKTHVSNRLICSIARQVAAALAYLSSVSGVDAKGTPLKGLIHRDLKPANILMNKDGERVAIADFGLCKDALRSGSTVVGTKPYMAPETLLYNSTSPASDIWALGVIVYELATLKRPNFLEGKEPKDVFIDGWEPDLSDVKNDFIRAILEKIFVLNPEKRLTARELHEMLSSCDVSADELGAQYMVLQHKCSSLETALNDASARIAILEGDTKTKSEKIITLEEALAIKASEMDSLRSIVVAQEANVDALKQDFETKSNKVDVLEHTLIAKSTKIDTIDGELENNSSDISTLKTIITAQTAEMDALKKELETRSDQIDAQSSKVAALEEELQTKSAETGSLKSTIAAQAAEIDVLKNSLITKSEKIDTLEAQCKEHLTMMKALENKIALLTASNPQSELFLLPRLMRAAHTNSTETVRMLVASGDGIGKRDEQGRTALMHAAQQGHVEPVRLLVEKEQGLQDRSGWTALMYAVYNNHFEVVEILAAHECGKRDNNNRTALMIAAEKGYTEIVAALAPHENGLTDDSGNTALMLAASNAHTEAVRVLVEHEKGARDARGRTALMTAAQRGDFEMVKVFAEYEKGITDESGCTALVYAVRNGHRDIAELLMEHEKDVTGWTMLMCAAALGDVEAVKNNLHEKGRKDVIGRTALMWAARWGHREVVEGLLGHEKGLKDTEGITAFTHALKNKHTDVALLLRDHEAPSWTPLMCAAAAGDTETAKRHLNEKDARNTDGDTAYTLAARAGQGAILELLDPTDEDGVTALMRAADRNDVEAVRALIPLQKGKKMMEDIHINGWKIYGGTALMRAAAHGHTEIVRLLVEYEAGMQDADGQTALMIAAAWGHIDCVKLLLEREAGMLDKYGWTALMYATYNNRLECARLLAEKEKDMKTTRERCGFPPGTAALDVAEKMGRTAIASILSG